MAGLATYWMLRYAVLYLENLVECMGEHEAPNHLRGGPFCVVPWCLQTEHSKPATLLLELLLQHLQEYAKGTHPSDVHHILAPFLSPDCTIQYLHAASFSKTAHGNMTKSQFIITDPPPLIKMEP